mmetsp:Transcript_1225/g.2903  ORF Transcript_1225/g.2903 Transcript_1225/m.2903 type:complete len:389 (-) Transcript_1225:283-1449(-)|eukprot:CAMPEP_0119560254 /NCGR_PEP_ID=MMETSP1352-20130426/14426_1 /TAXON_ID=265584 /ORGANISM="Stauroneis constricta, Strain CCMP1120" /LENGTH=388 /DNA_ID=CAMNT_0007608197 /DNA_START=259 /DNA_END=1425 /DNA_ORIENTATION=+
MTMTNEGSAIVSHLRKGAHDYPRFHDNAIKAASSPTLVGSNMVHNSGSPPLLAVTKASLNAIPPLVSPSTPQRRTVTTNMAQLQAQSDSALLHMAILAGNPATASALRAMMERESQANQLAALLRLRGVEGRTLPPDVSALSAAHLYANGVPLTLEQQLRLLTAGSNGGVSNMRNLMPGGGASNMSMHNGMMSNLLMREQAILSAAFRAGPFAAAPSSSPVMNGMMPGVGRGNSMKAGAMVAKKRDSIPLFMDCDEDSLSEYQCLIRKQIELFEADFDEANSSVQGRNKQVVVGQVGIRCRHCTCIPPRQRQRGCMYFPTKLDRIYQAAQNLSAFHLVEHCKHIPDDVRHKIKVLRLRKSPAGGGKRYWGEGVRCQGVYEDSAGLRFK